MVDTDSFKKNGFFTYSFESLTSLDFIQARCTEFAKDFFGDRFTTLANYHLLEVSNEQHEDFQYALFNQLNTDKYHRQFVLDNLAVFTALFGPDIDVQTNLYLRIARPSKETDNIGIHRDTDYGNSAYEVSLSLPLVSQVEGCGLNVIPQSHLFTQHNVRQFNREDVERGAPKNKMGFLYAPKEILGITDEQLHCISLPYGDGLGFSLGLIHGQKANKTNMTRWSIDFRIKNSFHPLTKNLKAGYYTPLKRSVVCEMGDEYYKLNDSERETLIGEL